MKRVTLRSLVAGISTGILLSCTANAAIAQVAEVPAPDSEGDFNSAILRGNRGFYANKRWVVMADPDGDYLNCRYTPNGEIRAEIVPGAILMAEFGGPVNLDNGLRANYDNDAIEMYQGSPWLRVIGQDDTLMIPAERGSRNALGTCYVRANQRYITPLNNEATLQTVFSR